MKAFIRLPIGTQFSILLAAFLAAVVAAAVFVGQSVIISQTTNEARSVADVVEHIGKWSTQYKGLWIKSTDNDVKPGTFLRKIEHNEAPEGKDPIKAEYHWKNPALIQREISDIAAQSTAPVKFRMTAKTVFNPDNAPTEFEKWALDRVSSSPDIKEASRVEQNSVQYARKLIVSKGCVACHGDFDKAPTFMKEKYPTLNGYGFKEGDVAGIISVSVPIPGVTASLQKSMGTNSWIAMGAVVVLFLVLLTFVFRSIIRPVNQMRRLAEFITQSQVGSNFNVPNMPASFMGSSNEIHRLGMSIAGLGNSVRLLYRKLNKERKRSGE